MAPSLRARAPPIYYERRTPRKRSCSTLLRSCARFKDRAGFEPADDFHRLRFSRPVFSTTQPSIHSRWVSRVHLTHLKSSFFTDAKSNVHGVRNCGSGTRTHDLRVMSPTILPLIYPAFKMHRPIFSTAEMVGGTSTYRFVPLDCPYHYGQQGLIGCAGLEPATLCL